MNISLEVAICALAMGVAAFFVVLPLASLIPMRLQQAWRREAAENAEIFAQPINPKDYEYTLTQKSTIIVCGAVIGLFVFARLGLSIDSGAQCFFLLGLLLLTAINLKHTLLPDYVVLFFLWCGLLYHATQGQSSDYIYGAVAGYILPLLILTAVQAKTGRSFIGYGDLKTFAMAGSWLGVQALPSIFIFFIASIVILFLFQRFARGKLSSVIPSGSCHFLASAAYVLGARAF